MFERFTDRARRVLVLAQEEAGRLGHQFIGSEHILLGLLHEGEGVGFSALAWLNISLDVARDKVKELAGRDMSLAPGSPPFTRRAKQVMELSLREALELGQDYIDTEHMLLALLRDGHGVSAQVLVSLGADLSRVRERVFALLPLRVLPEPRDSKWWASQPWPELGPVGVSVQEDLDARLERLPVRFLRRWSDYHLLQVVECEHVERLARRYSLSDHDRYIIEGHWLARVDADLAELKERLRLKQVAMGRDGRTYRHVRRHRRLHQLWWNTLGPGGETWFGDHLPIRGFLFRLCWRS